MVNAFGYLWAICVYQHTRATHENHENHSYGNLLQIQWEIFLERYKNIYMQLY